MTPLRLYRGATTLLGPFIYLFLLLRRRRGKEDRARFAERLGKADRPRPEGRLVWIHAASVGEATSALAFIDRLRETQPHLAILVTTGTVTSARLVASRTAGDGVLHQFVPVDRPRWVRRFLDHWRPDLAIWIESELWPVLVAETHARGVPMLLLNGRMSAGSFARWRRWPRLAGHLLGGFALCLAQDEAQAERLRMLGAPRALSVGDLKAAATPLPADGAELARLRKAIGHRPRWLAASTHPGEEAAALAAHRALAPHHPGLLTIVAPRHPARADEVAALAAEHGLALARWSRRELPGDGTQLLLVDTMGELGLFYRLCRIVFVGGSLTPMGGHNPLEPAMLGCAILHGPDMANCAAMAGELAAAGAAQRVADADALREGLAPLLADAGEAARRGQAAEAVAAKSRGVLDAILAEFAPWLDGLAPPRDDAAA
jgi:3-deoxy-D-manno-octulosonic-acid transferase